MLSAARIDLAAFFVHLVAANVFGAHATCTCNRVVLKHFPDSEEKLWAPACLLAWAVLVVAASHPQTRDADDRSPLSHMAQRNVPSATAARDVNVRVRGAGVDPARMSRDQESVASNVLLYARRDEALDGCEQGETCSCCYGSATASCKYSTCCVPLSGRAECFGIGIQESRVGCLGGCIGVGSSCVMCMPCWAVGFGSTMGRRIAANDRRLRPTWSKARAPWVYAEQKVKS